MPKDVLFWIAYKMIAKGRKSGPTADTSNLILQITANIVVAVAHTQNGGRGFA